MTSNKNHAFHVRLGYALKGLAHALKHESSFRIHALAAVLVLLMLLALRPSAIWWAVGGLTVGAVLAAELFNTALEHLADHLHPEQHARIKVVKDVAAAAVLITCMAALCVAAAFVVHLLP